MPVRLQPDPDRDQDRGAGRRGGVLPWLVIAGPVAVLAAFWTLQVANLRHRQLELQIAAEAAALAGADALVDDRLLTAGERVQEWVEADARREALRLAADNRVNGQRVSLDPNPANDPGGEIVLGTLPFPAGRQFDAAPVAVPDLYHPHRNTARVALKRHRVAISATAFVDRDVVGFQIQGAMSLPQRSGSPAPPAIPVLPLALRTDPCAPGSECLAAWARKDPESWEYRILARKGLNGDGTDCFRWKGTHGEVLPGPDGIVEMRVRFSPAGQGDNGRVVGVGGSSIGKVLSQVVTGVTAADLADRGGRLLLDQAVGGRPNHLTLPGLKTGAAQLESLADQCRQIVGQPRVWLLYREDPDAEGTRRRVDVLGFVAARILTVENEFQSGHLELVVQPCMLITATAVTDSARRNLGPRTLFNPYLARLRLVE